MRSYELGLYEKAMPGNLSWPEKFAAAGTAGYDFIELSIDASEEKIQRVYMSREERFALVSLMYETGVSLKTMNLSALTKYSLGNDDPSICSRGMDIALHAVDLAVALGTRLVMIPGYDVYYGTSTPDTAMRFLKNMERLRDYAAVRGVHIAFETMENEFMNTVEKAVKYTKLLNSAYVNLYPDIGNLTNAAVQYGTDVIADMKKGRGKLAALHLKETKPGVFRELSYGEGHVDFDRAIKAAWDLGIRSYVTEYWYTGNGNWPDTLSSVCARFRALLDCLPEAHL